MTFVGSGKTYNKEDFIKIVSARFPGERLREAIGMIMRDTPGICAADVRARLDATALGLASIPRKRAIRLHMQAIRRATPG